MTSTLLIRETIRPTKLAILLSHADGDLLRDAVTISSRLWGGVHNPIVILDQASRIRMGRQEQDVEPFQDEILGVLKDFDVDLVVTLGTDNLPPFLQAIFGHRHVTRDGLSPEMEGPPGASGQGRRIGLLLEVWPFIEHFAQEKKLSPATESDFRIVTSTERRKTNSLSSRSSVPIETPTASVIYVIGLVRSRSPTTRGFERTMSFESGYFRST